MLIECQECGRSISDKSENCIGCGAPEAVFLGPNFACAECGNCVTGAFKACPECGAPKRIFQQGTRNFVLDRRPKPVQSRRSKQKLNTSRGRTNSGLWARYFAKYIDFAILSVPATIVALIILVFIAEANGYYLEDIPTLIFGLIVLAAIAFFEAVQITAFKSTIGKSVFGIKVIDNSNGRLGLGSSLRRSVMSAIRGLGLGVPLIALFTCSAAYSYVKNEGTTGWDSAAGATYVSEPVNELRWSLGVVLFIASLAWVIFLTVLGMQDGY